MSVIDKALRKAKTDKRGEEDGAALSAPPPPPGLNRFAKTPGSGLSLGKIAVIGVPLLAAASAGVYWSLNRQENAGLQNDALTRTAAQDPKGSGTAVASAMAPVPAATPAADNIPAPAPVADRIPAPPITQAPAADAAPAAATAAPAAAPEDDPLAALLAGDPADSGSPAAPAAKADGAGATPAAMTANASTAAPGNKPAGTGGAGDELDQLLGGDIGGMGRGKTAAPPADEPETRAKAAPEDKKAEDLEPAAVALTKGKVLKTSDVVADLRKAIQTGDSAWVEERLGVLSSLRQKGDKDPYVLKLKAYWHMTRGKYIEAEPLLKQALEARENDLEAAQNLIIVELKTNRPDAAQARLKGLLERYPKEEGLQRLRQHFN
ncbi:MAG: tetratricopeptide repeat protein [Magnetococcales bacterium]|nr:tetratricopeptide repeat protein [Magnetococcales bacterium]